MNESFNLRKRRKFDFCDDVAYEQPPSDFLF